MIKTIDLTEFCSRVEQSNQLADPVKRRVPSVDATRAGRIGKALDYMLQHLEMPIKIAALGKIAGMSSSHFYLLFKTATGCTPNDFFIRARMRHACELLRSTDLSVKEVAATLGYDDQFYFSRVFKSVNGVPPREYRVMTTGLKYPKNTTLEPSQRKTFESLVPFPVNRGETSRITPFQSPKSHRTSSLRKPTQQNKTNP